MDKNYILDFKHILDKYCKGIISNKTNYEGFSPIDASKTNLFWPCMLYQVEVRVDTAKLDIFERTVLKLAECKITRTKDVALVLGWNGKESDNKDNDKSMGMNPDTIEFIQNRLVVKGLLKERIFSLTEEGKNTLDKFCDEKSTGEIKVVCLLQDLHSGRFLDYVADNPERNLFRKTFIKSDPLSLKTEFSLPGGERQFKGYVVVPKDKTVYDKYKDKKNNPETFHILRTIRKFEDNAGEDSPIHLNQYSNSADIKSKEVVLVHTKGFTTSSGTVYSTDAAGLGVSDMFSDFIKKADDNDYPWIRKIIEKGNVVSEKNSDERLVEKEINWEYKEISKTLYDVICDWATFKEKPNKENNELREETKRIGEKIIYKVYTAFEHALQMYYEEYNDKTNEDIMIGSANDEARKQYAKEIDENEYIDSNIRICYLLAKNLGFESTLQNDNDHLDTFLKVYPGQIDTIRKKRESELVPLLCLSLAYANTDKECPLARLAMEHPDFIKKLSEYKDLRDKTLTAHGPGLTANDVSEKKLNEIIQNIMLYAEFLNAKLAKDFKILRSKSNNTVKSFESNSAKILQERYSNKIKLYDDFGYSAINRLNTNLINQMINWQMSLKEKMSVVGSSCSILQQFFEKAISSILNRTNPPRREDRNAKTVEEKCRAVGFSLDNNKLPDTLSTVNGKKINKAACGGGCDSLGAAVLAFILLLSDKELSDIASRQRRMILDLGDLLKQRGHSDIREYSDSEVSAYKKLVTNIIKEVIEFI